MARRLCMWCYWEAQLCCLVWTAAQSGWKAAMRRSSRLFTGTTRHQGSSMAKPTVSLTCMPQESNVTMGHSSSSRKWTSQPLRSPMATSHLSYQTYSLGIRACTHATCITTTVACMRDAAFISLLVHLSWGNPPMFLVCCPMKTSVRMI